MNYLLSDIARIVGGELRGEDLRVREVATDSRSVVAAEDVVFAAIDGKNHDGHQFIERMVARGVEAFIVERDVELPTLADLGSDLQNGLFKVDVGHIVCHHLQTFGQRDTGREQKRQGDAVYWRDYHDDLVQSGPDCGCRRSSLAAGTGFSAGRQSHG